MKYSLLLVEDDTDLGALLTEYLVHHDFLIDWVTDGEAFWASLLLKKYDLILLDVMVPNEDGFTIADKLRVIDPRQPFLFITARKMKADILHGLRLGADDYIVKPFDPDEIILRVTNILKRRLQTGTANTPYIMIGKYHFNPAEYQLTTPDKCHTLTVREAEILKYLYDHRDQLVHRPAILNDLWKNADFFNGRSMDVYMTRLRKLLADDPAIEITSIRGIGYRFSVP